MEFNYIKDGAIYLASSALQNFFPFILLPFLINTLSAEEYGAYSLILTLTTLSSTFFSFGLSSSLGRYFYDINKQNYREKLVNTSFNFTVLVFLFFILFIFIFSDEISDIIFKSNDYSNEILLCSIASFLFIIFNLFTTIFRFNFKSKKYFFTCVSTSILNFIITLVLLNHGFKILAPIYGLLYSSFFGLIFSLIISEFKLKFRLSSSIIKKLLIFGFPTALNGLLFYLLDWSDKFIVNDLIGTENTGVYSFGYKIGAVLNICLIMPVHLIWGPYRLKNAKTKYLSKQTSKIIDYYIISGLFLVLFFTLLGENIFELFFSNKEFAFSYDIFPIIMIALLIFGLQGFVDFGIYYAAKLHFYMICGGLGLMINWSLNYYLIPRIGLMGAAYATLLTYTFTSSFFYIVSNKYFRIKLNFKLIAPILIFVFVLLITTNYNIDSVVYNIIILVVFLFMSVGLIVPKKDVKFLNPKTILKILTK